MRLPVRPVLLSLPLVLAPCAPRQALLAPLSPEREQLAVASATPERDAEALALLRAYLAIPTVNPPGQEEAGARWMADVLARDGIAAEVDVFLPGRANLIARLPATHPSGEAPLCLLSHLDVVPADAEAWKHGPFSGDLDAEGYVWGRGALDMKSVGIVELVSFLELHRRQAPLRRDVILLAVADEEVDNLGVKHLAEHRWAELGCGHVLNEGGLGVEGALVEGLTTYAVSYAEKGALWARVVATGAPGHGSTPLPDDAPARLVEALTRIEAWRDRPEISPELMSLLGAIGGKAGGITGAVLRSPALTRALATPQLMDNPLTAAILTDTVHITGFGGAESPNVVPGEVWAQLDVRLLPGTTSDEMLATLRGLLPEPHYRIEVLSALEAATSPTDDPVFRAIVDNLQRAFPAAAVGPVVMPGTTDSQVLRPLGARCYGVAPFAVSQEELHGFHGHNERLHRDVFLRGLDVFFRVVVDVVTP
jgi:acetylornithine deacetylase/succinyl-diaminopimelate desuccinylase-like protein